MESTLLDTIQAVAAVGGVAGLIATLFIQNATVNLQARLIDDQRKLFELERKKTMKANEPLFIIDDVEQTSVTNGIISEGSALSRAIRLKRNIAIGTCMIPNIPEFNIQGSIPEQMDAGDSFEISFSMNIEQFVEGKLVAELWYRDHLGMPYIQLVYWDTLRGNLNTKLPINQPNDVKTSTKFIVAKKS